MKIKSQFFWIFTPHLLTLPPALYGVLWVQFSSSICSNKRTTYLLKNYTKLFHALYLVWELILIIRCSKIRQVPTSTRTGAGPPTYHPQPLPHRHITTTTVNYQQLQHTKTNLCYKSCTQTGSVCPETKLTIAVAYGF